MATLSGETAKASAFPISRFLLSKVDFPLRVQPVPYSLGQGTKLVLFASKPLEIGIVDRETRREKTGRKMGSCLSLEFRGVASPPAATD